MNDYNYDAIGKVDMSGIYNNAEPTRYFRTLERLGYRIPQEAKPLFRQLMRARRALSAERQLKVLDLGCSYGVNAALLKHGLDLADLYRHYGSLHVDGRSELLRADREFLGEPMDGDLTFVGIDTAERAIDYAVEVGALDEGLSADFEREVAGDDARDAMNDVDLVISTGCFGYVTEKSLARILDMADGEPWMAHFVLRMFDFDEAEQMFAEHGYVTEKIEGLFPQRRFASAEERERVLANLAAEGINPSGAELTGWYFAELYVSRPRADVAACSSDAILGEALQATRH